MGSDGRTGTTTTARLHTDLCVTAEVRSPDRTARAVIGRTAFVGGAVTRGQPAMFTGDASPSPGLMPLKLPLPFPGR